MRLGADPEVFLLNRKNQQFKSVIGLIGANKWNPAQIPGMPDGFTLQEDNVALEFGVPPASSSTEFVNNIRQVLRAGLEKLPSTRFSRLSCTVFPESEMEEPAAWIFGCEPDFNAWTGEENEKPTPPHQFMRSAGGHIHVETELDKRNVIRAMDLFLGVPSVLMDSGTERRKLYGKAGAFRPKPYGVEYRTLSNFWIFRPKLIDWAWRQTEEAIAFLNCRGADGDDFSDEHLDLIGNDIQTCINEDDKILAEKIVKEYGLELV